MLNKYLISILFLFLISSTTEIYSQRFLGAVSAGINLSQVDGDEVYGFKKVGFDGGPSIIFPFGKDKKWSLTMEILFSMNGAYEKGSDTIPPDPSKPAWYYGYKLNLNYVQVPILVHFTDKKLIAGGLGFSYGQLVSVKEWEDGYQTETSLNGPYALADFRIVADVRLRLWKRLWGNIRYSYSLLPIRSREFYDNDPDRTIDPEVFTRKQYNNVITLRLVYIFNDPFVKAREGNTVN